jgi:hypothetical protein
MRPSLIAVLLSFAVPAFAAEPFLCAKGASPYFTEHCAGVRKNNKIEAMAAFLLEKTPEDRLAAIHSGACAHIITPGNRSACRRYAYTNAVSDRELDASLRELAVALLNGAWTDDLAFLRSRGEPVYRHNINGSQTLEDLAKYGATFGAGEFAEVGARLVVLRREREEARRQAHAARQADALKQEIQGLKPAPPRQPAIPAGYFHCAITTFGCF